MKVKIKNLLSLVIAVIIFLVNNLPTYGGVQQDKIGRLKNAAPTATFSMVKPKKIDIQVVTDYTGQKLNDLLVQLGNTRMNLFNKNVDMQFAVTDGTEKTIVGAVRDTDDTYVPNSYGGGVKNIVNENNQFTYGATSAIFPNILTNVRGARGDNGSTPSTYYAYTNDGRVYGWGRSPFVNSALPVEMWQEKLDQPTLYPDLQNVVDVVPLSYFTAFLLKDGSVKYTGYDYFGYNLINYGPHMYTTAKTIPVLSGTKQLLDIDGTGYLALKKDGTVYAQGRADLQFGDIDYSRGDNLGHPYWYTSNPQKIRGIDNVDRLIYAYGTVFAIKKDGTVWIWGSNRVYDRYDRQIDAPLGVPSDAKSLYGNGLDSIKVPRNVAVLNSIGREIADIKWFRDSYYIVKKDGTVWTYSQSSGFKKVESFKKDVYVITGYDYDGDPIREYRGKEVVTEATNVVSILQVISNEGITFVKADGSIFSYFPLTYVGTWAESTRFEQYKMRLQPIYSHDKSKVINFTPREGSDRYLIYVADGTGENFAADFGNYYPFVNLDNDYVTKVAKDGYNIYCVTPTTNLDYVSDYNSSRLSLRNLASSSVGETRYYDGGQWQRALDDMSAKYQVPEQVADYLIAGEDIIYNVNYADYENDPKIGERWKYDHNPNVFDNNSGVESYSGQWLTGPKTPIAKVGKYDITLQVRDNPKSDSRFDMYKIWSPDIRKTIYAHRRPIADFQALITGKDGNGNYITAVNDGSYDLDHTSRADKGINAWQWRWKEINASGWNDGYLPSLLPPNKTYLVQLKVRDLEGAWSDPKVKEVSTGNVNFTPTVDANPPSYGWTNQDIYVTVTADDNGENDFNRVSYTTTTGVVEPGWSDGTMYQKSFPLTYTAEGIWYLHMRVWDNAGNTFYRYRGPYLIDKTLPGATATPYNQAWTNQDVNVNFAPWDALSGVKQWRYRTSDNDGATYGAWSGYAWGPTATNINFTYQGLHKIQAEIIDNAGNVNYVNSGPYLNDKVAPDINVDKPGPLEAFNSVTVNISLSDNLSGVKQTRYCFTNSTARPTAWNTSTAPIITATQTEEGVWYLHVESEDNAGNISYKILGSYTVINFTVAATLVPNPALAGDELIFTVNTTGFVDKIQIFVDPDIIAKDNRTQYTYPLQYHVDGSVDVKTTDIRYILCVWTDQTLTKDNVRLRPEYTFIVRGFRGNKYKDVVLKLDVRRSVLELIHPGVLQN